MPCACQKFANSTRRVQLIYDGCCGKSIAYRLTGAFLQVIRPPAAVGVLLSTCIRYLGQDRGVGVVVTPP